MKANQVLLTIAVLSQIAKGISWWKYQGWDYDFVSCWTDADCEFSTTT